MGLEVDEPKSTPKLSLPKLPCKLEEATQMLTPPLHPSVSIPFQWEEAPGKPRASADEAAPPAIPLPPRLSYDDAIMPSQAVVFDGPRRSLSLAWSVSGREEGLRPMKINGCCGNIGSRRWGRVKGEEKLGRTSFDFSQSLGDFLNREQNVKSTRLGRLRSFFNSSTNNSNLLDIYASFKQAVSWRRR